VPRWIQFNNNGKEIDVPAETPAIELVDAKEAYEAILAKAGCWPRDRVTKRTIHEVITRTGAWGRNAPLEPTDEWFLEGLTPSMAPMDTDGDGMPDGWEKLQGLNSNDPTDASTIVLPGKSSKDRHQGYSYLEFYINELAENLVP
jgi:pectate lyase